MQPTDHTILLSELVQQLKKPTATEDLLIYIAATDGMVDLCKNLTSSTHEKLNEAFINACTEHNLNPTTTLATINEILRSLHLTNGNLHYAYEALGLASDASFSEVKKAFRKLSMKYHPDHTHGEESSHQFIEIQQAYDTIQLYSQTQIPNKGTPWVAKKTRNTLAGPKKRNFFYGCMALLMVLIFASLLLNQTNKSKLLQQHTKHPTSSANNHTTVTRQHQLAEQLFANDNSNSQLEDDTTKTNLTENLSKDEEIPILELEAVIPPDPELLASLEQPFPFRNSAIDRNTPPPEDKKAVVNASHVTNKNNKEFLQKQKEMESQIKALEAKINQLEQQKTDDTPLKIVATSTPLVPVVSQEKKLTNSASKTSKDPSQTLNNTTVNNTSLQDTPAVAESSKPNTEYSQTLVIQSFLKQYAATYSQRNFSAHLQHFADNATENNKPIQSLRKAYINLFDKTSEISLDIYNYRWEKNDGKIYVQGAFTARYTYKKGKLKTYNGSVKFTLISNRDNKLMIEKMDYILH